MLRSPHPGPWQSASAFRSPRQRSSRPPRAPRLISHKTDSTGCRGRPSPAPLPSSRRPRSSPARSRRPESRPSRPGREPGSERPRTPMRAATPPAVMGAPSSGSPRACFRSGGSMNGHISAICAIASCTSVAGWWRGRPPRGSGLPGSAARRRMRPALSCHHSASCRHRACSCGLAHTALLECRTVRRPRLAARRLGVRPVCQVSPAPGRRAHRAGNVTIS